MENAKQQELPILNTNARELHIIEFVAGLHAKVKQGEEILRDRLGVIPGGWRDWRTASGRIQKVLDGIYQTMPTKTLKHMQRLCDCGEVVIRPKPMIKMPDDVQIVLKDDLKLMINRVISAECAMCVKDGREQKKCALRKALENIAPTAAVHKNGLCAYVDVATMNELGEYI